MSENKKKYAEVFTPPELVDEIIEILKPIHFSNSLNPRIYEPGIGKGAFLNKIIEKLPFKSYEGCEINPSKETFNINPKINISIGDFFNQSLNTYDLIIGNPPFYNDGFKGPPCSKTRKGKTIWPQIVKKCFEHLEPNGILAMIIPCIWLKPDKEQIYDLFTTNQILYLRVYSCVESNKLFHYHAQTPCCYVIVQKTHVINSFTNSFMLYDNGFKPFSLKPGYCIPTCNSQLIQNFIPTYKLNMKKVAFINKSFENEIIKNPTKHFPIITTFKDGPYGFESLKPGLYQGIPKIIMAHKSLPIPFLDISGTYGLYGRDKYVFLGPNLHETFAYLSLPIIQTIIKSFTIRMNFYEKDIFKYINGCSS